MISVFALCSGYIELDRASMLEDLSAGQPWTVPVTITAAMVCAADACYTHENMDRDVLPRILWNGAIMREFLATLRRLRDQAGATMFYGHDPEQWQATPRAPAPIAL